MPARFVERRGWLEDVLHAAPAAAVLRDHAERVASEITAASPTKKITFRASGDKAVTDSSIWHIVNYGSVNNQPYRFIDKGVARAGLRFDTAR